MKLLLRTITIKSAPVYHVKMSPHWFLKTMIFKDTFESICGGGGVCSVWRAEGHGLIKDEQVDEHKLVHQ